jgi:Uma2 family endonuclease
MPMNLHGMDLHGIDAESTVRILPEHRMSSEEFFRFCQANPEWRIEQSADGEITIMPPAGGETGHRNFEVSADLAIWTRKDGRGKGFDSNTGFELPNGATRAPDAAWVSKDRLGKLTDKQKRVFLPVCPEFVIEIQSPSDSLPQLKRQMHEWIDNGAQLGWLIQPDVREVVVYRPGNPPELFQNLDRIEGEGPVAGFVLDLIRVWAPL